MSLAERLSPARCPRLVLKIGSSLLVRDDGTPQREWLGTLLDDVVERRAAGQGIAIVSSGAVALGARRLALPSRGRAELEDSQAAAACGQIALAGLYAELLGERGLRAAQILLTLGDLEDRRRYLNVAATLDRLLGLGAVPVLNENDSVATTEIRFGDNDRLAARVAQAAGAAAVLLLSDVEGLMTADPAANPTARLIPVVGAIDNGVVASASAVSGSGLGTGGMASKIEAARLARAAGIDLAIALGSVDHPLRRLESTGRGTLFIAGADRTRRGAWLAGGLTSSGRIHVDAGAARALARGASLLAAGVVGADGGFSRGDVVEVVGPAGVIARGIAAYEAVEVLLIAGTRRDAQAALLGYPPRAALIHRDHLVLT